MKIQITTAAEKKATSPTLMAAAKKMLSSLPKALASKLVVVTSSSSVRIATSLQFAKAMDNQHNTSEPGFCFTLEEGPTTWLLQFAGFHAEYEGGASIKGAAALLKRLLAREAKEYAKTGEGWMKLVKAGIKA